MSANIRAFLAMLRHCEGTSGPDGYRTIVGGELFPDLRDHPRIVRSGVFKNGVPWKSSAAGAYQFLSSTWDRAKHALGLPSFQPACQDEAAVWLIKQRNALEDVEAGRIAEAIKKCALEWASLPTSPYGQPVKTMEECLRVYQAAGGFIATEPKASAAPIAEQSSQTAGEPSSVATQKTPPPVVPAPSAPEPRGTTMPIPALVTAAASALLPIVVDLFRARGSKTSERNAEIIEAAAPVLVEIAKQVVPSASNEQAAAEKILADKTLQEQFRAAVALKWADVEPFFRAEEESRTAARSFAVQMTSSGPPWRQIGFGVALFTLALIILVGGGWMLYLTLIEQWTTPEMRGNVIAAVISFLSLVLGYFFGSSATSRIKDQTIMDQAARK